MNRKEKNFLHSFRLDRFIDISDSTCLWTTDYRELSLLVRFFSLCHLSILESSVLRLGTPQSNVRIIVHKKTKQRANFTKRLSNVYFWLWERWGKLSFELSMKRTPSLLEKWRNTTCRYVDRCPEKIHGEISRFNEHRSTNSRLSKSQSETNKSSRRFVVKGKMSSSF